MPLIQWQGTMAKGNSEYDDSLSSYQAAFAAELDQCLDWLPLTPASRVLDVPCGNGFYSRLLSRRLGPGGRLVAVDGSERSLRRVRRRLREATCSWLATNADAYHLPFEVGEFDLVWCAQSLISLEAETALLEMKRVVRPGGTIAVLENDIFHQVLLPWPVHLEIPVQEALRKAARARFGSSTKWSPVRRLPAILEKIGLSQFQKHTFAADRTTPWSAAVRRFLQFHIRDLAKLTRGKLTKTARREFREFAQGSGSGTLLGAGAKDLSCLNVLYLATR